ncbi:MAG TPA: hypothetical protein VLH10_23050 [Yinghuangia sp.]|nr:hypothetical protein [Yinghuangia sp.]
MHPGPASHPGDGGTPSGFPGHGRSVPPPPPPGPPHSPTPGGFGAPARPYGGPAVTPAPPPPGSGPLPPDDGYPPSPMFGSSRPADRPDPKPAYSALRGVGAFLCLLLTVLLTVPAVSASWLKEELISESGFADNATALIDKPAIRDEIKERISNEVIERAQLPRATEEMVIASVGSVMETDEFRRVWKEGASAAHNVVVSSLLGKDSELVDTNGDNLTIKFRTPLEPLFAELTKAGVEFDRDAIPTEIPVPLADIPASGTAQDTLRGIDDAGWMLPFLAIALLLVGVGIAVHRLRALALTAMGTLVMGGLLLVITNLARSPVVDEASKGSDLSSEATGSVYDVFTDTLVTDAWIVIVISIVMLAGTAVTGALLRNRRATA